MEFPVGLKFRPTDEEIIVNYLRPKNVDENTSHVDKFIETVTISKSEPWDLPRKSKITRKDRQWCFFNKKEKYKRCEKKQARQTKAGKWKITGKPTSIFGNGDQKIGEKKVLMFYFENGDKSDWVMHEYHVLSPDDQMMKYSFCKVIFKGEEIENPSHSLPAPLFPHDTNYGRMITTVNEVFQRQELHNPGQFSGILDEQQETQMDDSIHSHMSSDDWDSWLAHKAQIDDDWDKYFHYYETGQDDFRH